jgi:hypothetical protein
MSIIPNGPFSGIIPALKKQIQTADYDYKLVNRSL